MAEFKRPVILFPEPLPIKLFIESILLAAPAPIKESFPLLSILFFLPAPINPEGAATLLLFPAPIKEFSPFFVPAFCPLSKRVLIDWRSCSNLVILILS